MYVKKRLLDLGVAPYFSPDLDFIFGLSNSFITTPFLLKLAKREKKSRKPEGNKIEEEERGRKKKKKKNGPPRARAASAPTGAPGRKGRSRSICVKVWNTASGSSRVM